MEICNTCDKLDTEGGSCVDKLNGPPCCSACGCSLSLKLRATSASCPLNKWLAVSNFMEEGMIKDAISKNQSNPNEELSN